MELDFPLSGISGDSLHLLEIEYLALLSPHGAFDGTRADLEREWAACCPLDGFFNLFERERCPALGERNHVQVAERVDAVERIAINVAFGLRKTRLFSPH